MENNFERNVAKNFGRNFVKTSLNMFNLYKHKPSFQIFKDNKT